MAHVSHIVVQKWEESEQGWGVRPDGFSLHLTDEDRAKFIEAYWAEMPDAVPAEYERPCGTPYLSEVEPSTLTLLKERLAKGIFGVRVYNKPYPGNGGADGWTPRRPYHGGKA